MRSLLYSPSLLVSISALAAASSPITRDTRRPTDVWTLSNIYIGCGTNPDKGGDFCSYQFDVLGEENDSLPGFSAQCYQRVAPGDETVRPCNITGGWSALKEGRTVRSVDAVGTFCPGQGEATEESSLIIQLTWYQEDSPSAGTINVWRAEETGQYEYFSQDISDPLDVVPRYYQAIAVN